MVNWMEKFGIKQEAPDPRQLVASVIEGALREIAGALFRHGRSYVDVRYRRGSAELFTQELGVIARVTVYGENGTPDLIDVECSLSSKEESLFSHYMQHLPDLRIEFRTLQSRH